MSRDEDAKLIDQFRRGSIQAFELLMRRYWHDIKVYAYRHAKNDEDAEDIAQEVFAKVYRALPAWKPQASFKTWLYTIARNMCTDHYRGRSRRPTQSLEALQDDSFEEPPVTDFGSDPERLLEDAEIKQLITEALNELSDQQREVFILYHYQHLQIKEIAELLGIADGTVKMHRHRAMKKLRMVLEPYWKLAQEG